MKERLLLYIHHLGISQAKFEKACGLSNGFVNNIGFSIRENSLIKITKSYPSLNKSWLLTGDGEMLIDKGSSAITEEPVASYGEQVKGNDYYKERFAEVTEKLYDLYLKFHNLSKDYLELKEELQAAKETIAKYEQKAAG